MPKPSPYSRFNPLLDKVDLVDLAEKAGAKFGEHTAGKRHVYSVCPLHSKADNPTAFVVSTDPDGRQSWRCFTQCNNGGSAIDFMMAWQGLDFGQAVLELCDRYKVDPSEIGWGDPQARAQAIEAAQQRKQRLDLLTEAQRFFAQRLWSRDPGARNARRYLYSRGFHLRTLKALGWGYSTSNNALANYLLEKGADVAEMHATGLVRGDGKDFTANRDGDQYGQHGWIVFPHFVGGMANGRVEYFSARAVEVDGQPRPKPTEKSRNLPGDMYPYRCEVNDGKAKNQGVTLCEGPLDAASLWQAHYTAWAMGGLPAMDEDNLARLRRRKVVYVAVDSDKAGKQALDRDRGVGRTADALGPLTMVLPDNASGKDFNAWLQSGSMTAEALAEHYKGSQTWLEKRLEEAQGCVPTELDGWMRDISKLMSGLPEGARPRYYQIAANALGLTRREIADLVHQAMSNGRGDGEQILSSIKEGRLCFLGKALLNGWIKIVGELSVEDGQELPVVRYTVAGQLASGEALSDLEVEADAFGDFRWISRHWGHRVILYVPRGQFYELARAVQECSDNVRRERVFTYTGWATVNGQRSYLSASGALSADGLNPDIRVDLTDTFQNYALPEPPQGLAAEEAVRASLGFLSLGPRGVTAPLWAATFAAPLTEIAPLYAVLWVYGGSQSGKSTITHMVLAHFGAGFIKGRQFTAPKDWTSSATSLEGAMFRAKDTLMVIDDFAPQAASKGDSRDMGRKAAYVVRSVGNRSSRGRSYANLTDRQTRVPRGLVVATAENPLMGLSVVGRTIYLCVGRGDFVPTPEHPEPRPDMDQAQAHAQAGLYAQAMSLYLRWLAANWERVKAEFPKRVDSAARRIREQYPNMQARLPDYYALLAIAQETALTAFVEMGLATQHTAQQLADANCLAILEVIRGQAERIAAESPISKIFEALSALLARRKVYLGPRKNSPTPFVPPYGAELIGWFDPFDDRTIYLDTTTCLAQAREFWERLNENLDFLPDAITSQMRQITGLITVSPDGKSEKSVWVAGKNRRVLVVSRTRVMELYGLDLANEPATPGEEPADPAKYKPGAIDLDALDLENNA